MAQKAQVCEMLIHDESTDIKKEDDDSSSVHLGQGFPVVSDAPVYEYLG